MSPTATNYYRGSAPVRQLTFVSAKVTKAIAPDSAAADCAVSLAPRWPQRVRGRAIPVPAAGAPAQEHSLFGDWRKVRIWTSPQLQALRFFGGEVRLLTYIRSLTAASFYNAGP